MVTLSPLSEAPSSGKFIPCACYLLHNCFPRLSSLSLTEKWQWRTNLVLNALLLIAPYVTHLGHGSFGFSLCVFREGNGNKPTEEATSGVGSPARGASSHTLFPGRSPTEGDWVRRATRVCLCGPFWLSGNLFVVKLNGNQIVYDLIVGASSPLRLCFAVIQSYMSWDTFPCGRCEHLLLTLVASPPPSIFTAHSFFTPVNGNTAKEEDFWMKSFLLYLLFSRKAISFQAPMSQVWKGWLEFRTQCSFASSKGNAVLYLSLGCNNKLS